MISYFSFAPKCHVLPSWLMPAPLLKQADLFFMGKLGKWQSFFTFKIAKSAELIQFYKNFNLILIFIV
jgi:hypothetical protein